MPKVTHDFIELTDGDIVIARLDSIEIEDGDVNAVERSPFFIYLSIAARC